MTVSRHALELGHHLDEYVIVEILGSGGFGITYRAIDPSLQRYVAIKEYFPEQFADRHDDHTVAARLGDDHEEKFQWGLNRFLSEARTLAQFEHPNIVNVTRFFEANGTAYLVMKFEEGKDLQSWLQNRTEPPSESEILSIILPVLDGLEKVHALELVHRDIKPQNIMLRGDKTPVLIDFGSARAMSRSQNTALTALVSPGYSPPEQYGVDPSGQGPWTDIYAISGFMYRMIAGIKPPDVVQRMAGASMTPAQEIGLGRISAGMLAAIDRGLELKTLSRPQSVAEFRVLLAGKSMSSIPPTRQEADESTIDRESQPYSQDEPRKQTVDIESPSTTNQEVDKKTLVRESAKHTPPNFKMYGGGILAIVFLLLVGFIILTGWRERPNSSPKAYDPKSIAVLPFVNMSDDSGNEYFSDGLSEEILNLLAKIPDLKVIGRTSSFAFKGKNEDLRVIGEALGVTTVLEGSVRKSGERVRITAQLVDVSDGAHIWSETYDRTLSDIFAVQDDVAAAIIDALQIHVGTNPTRGRPTESTEAYALFLKARASINTYEFRDAKEILMEAIERDPTFAEAYELLAFSYWWLAGTVVKAAEGQKLMGEAAAKALAIDPDLVLAQAMYQSGNIESWSLLGEIEAFERAAREQPGKSAPLRALTFKLMKAGYLQEALTVAERRVELEPLSPAANNRLSEVLLAVGRTNEAVAALELADQLGSTAAKWVIGAVNLVDKQDDIAIAHFEAWLQQHDYPDSTWIRELVTGARNPATGQAYLDSRIPQIVASMPEEEAYDRQRTLTMWYLAFGFLDRYFELIFDFDLDATWTDADSLVYAGTIFSRLGFTAHPKYLEVAELLGIVELWEQRGPPDFCEKLGGEWVCE